MMLLVQTLAGGDAVSGPCGWQEERHVGLPEATHDAVWHVLHTLIGLGKHVMQLLGSEGKHLSNGSDWSIKKGVMHFNSNSSSSSSSSNNSNNF